MYFYTILKNNIPALLRYVILAQSNHISYHTEASGCIFFWLAVVLVQKSIFLLKVNPKRWYHLTKLFSLSTEMSVLRDYIAYAKQTFNPKLTDEAGTLLTQSYVRMRQVGSGRGQITAYPR